MDFCQFSWWFIVCRYYSHLDKNTLPPIHHTCRFQTRFITSNKIKYNYQKRRKTCSRLMLDTDHQIIEVNTTVIVHLADSAMMYLCSPQIICVSPQIHKHIQYITLIQFLQTCQHWQFDCVSGNHWLLPWKSASMSMLLIRLSSIYVHDTSMCLHNIYYMAVRWKTTTPLDSIASNRRYHWGELLWRARRLPPLKKKALLLVVGCIMVTIGIYYIIVIVSVSTI